MRILTAFILAGLWSLLLNLIATRVGKKLRCTVRPRLFKSSRRSVTYLGGIAVAAASVVGFLLNSKLHGALPALLGGGAAFLVMGFIDDRLTSRNGINPLARLLMGASISFSVWFWALRPVLDVPVWLDGLIVVIFLTGAANAFNLVDNMNGVAGATAAAVAAGIATIGMVSGQLEIAALAAAVGAACLAFLPFNIRKSTVYLGDSGALFLGFILAGLALMLRPASTSGINFLVAVALMTVPFTDTVVRQISRWVGGRSILDIEGGTDHISHRLVGSGMHTTEAAAVHGMAALGVSSAAVITSVNEWVGPAAVAICVFSAFGLFFSLTNTRWARSRAPLKGVAVAGAVAAASLLAAVGPAVKARGELMQVRGLMLQGAAAARSLDPVAARAAFGRAQALAVAAETRLDSALVLPARLVPLAGDSFDTAHAIASASVSLASAAQEAAQAVAFIVQPEGSGEPLLLDGKISMTGWSSAAKLLDSAATEAGLGLRKVQSASGLVIPPVAQARREFLNEAGPAVKALDKGKIATAVVPKLLGSDGPRTWFLAVQNGAELRGTGGLIGAFGILKTDNGRVTLERLDPDRMLPKLDRPVEAVNAAVKKHYAEYESNRLWENVNMTADFPTAASLITRMWEQGTGERVDGVMAIDVPGLAALMPSVGQVRVPELKAKQSVDSANLAQALLSDAYAAVPKRAERQDTLVAVGREAFARFLKGGSHSNSASLIRSLTQAASGKHLMLWSRTEAKTLERMGVSGAMSRPSQADHLMVVAQNALASKMDFYARRHLTYDVRIDDKGRVEGDLGVKIQNDAPASGITPYVMGKGRGENRSYVSVYMAPAAGMLAAKVNGKPSPVQSHMEKGFPVTSRVVDIPRGGNSTFNLSTSGLVLEKPGEYRLVIDRQPALYADSIKVSIRLPEGAVAKSVSSGMQVQGRTVTWSGKLDSDKELVVRYDTTPLARLRQALRQGP